MNNRNAVKYFIILAFSLTLFITGLVIVILVPDAEGILKTLPFICIGVGAGIFGGSFGTAVKNLAINKNPQAAKQVGIEAKDERNRTINNKAKASVYNLMIYVYAAVILAFALIQIDVYVLLTLVGIYLFFIFAYVYYFSKYYKEM